MNDNTDRIERTKHISTVAWISNELNSFDVKVNLKSGLNITIASGSTVQLVNTTEMITVVDSTNGRHYLIDADSIELVDILVTP